MTNNTTTGTDIAKKRERQAKSLKDTMVVDESSVSINPDELYKTYEWERAYHMFRRIINASNVTEKPKEDKIK